MEYSSQQLPSGKWGIYHHDEQHTTTLLATISCEAICQTILANLANGRKDAPVDDINELYQVPILRSKTQKTPAQEIIGRRTYRRATAKRKPKKSRTKKGSQATDISSASQKITAVARPMSENAESA
ncbi:MAG: hypothetical protein AAFY72_17340 [Cyanobacteria bacterium J06649_4]